ncbi:MAG: NADPH-dependent assimilatory sulfite reductase hemoprotein subunit [Hyphomicrobium sp.]
MSDTRSKNETIKENSRLLRGTIAEGLKHSETGSIVEDDTQLLKFHGSYMQDDRDVRGERAKKKLEKAFSFMIRLRIPGGAVTPDQWKKLDDIATTFANGTLRITTRATFQYHGVIKSNLKRTMQSINAACLDTLAACGDVNRNVMSASHPFLSKAHKCAEDLAKEISAHLLPRTGAYHEIWLDNEKIIETGGTSAPESEPLYGKHYLPRKFKTVIAVPPDNDVDVYAHDLGYIAIVEKGDVIGWNVTVGGGMGMTHGELDTFPRTADLLGFCLPHQAVNVAEKVLTVQRDWGNRALRKNARLKYTIERVGLEAFRTEVEKRLGFKLEKSRPFKFTSTGDKIGWRQTLDDISSDKKWHLTLSIENGRVGDKPKARLRSALREIANYGGVDFVLTSNQNLVLANISSQKKATIEEVLKKNGISLEISSGLRRNAMACVALPTCGLALAESERFLPHVVDDLEGVLDKVGLKNEDIVIRMTGCPNGCARPYLAEIGLVGRSPGLYNLYLGAAFDGTRLSKLYAQDVGQDQILKLLTPLIQKYASERSIGEHFGDFVIRKGIVKPTTEGKHFHEDVDLASV